MDNPATPPPDSGDKLDQEIKVSGQARVGRIYQIGKQIVNGIDEKIFKRLHLEMRVGFILLGAITLLILGGVGYLVYQEQPTPVNMRETGCQLCIAVAGFNFLGEDDSQSTGTSFASTFSVKLEDSLSTLNSAMLVTPVWGPDLAGSLQGVAPDQMDAQAEALAKKIQADILVYGKIDASGQVWKITPMFYINPDYIFSDAIELLGPDQLGASIESGARNSSLKLQDLNMQILPRGRVFSTVIAGMTWYLLEDYRHALELFQIETLLPEADQESSSMKLVYLVIGNTYGKLFEHDQQLTDLDHAEQSYNLALDSDPNYARGIAGLGSVTYQKALLSTIQSKNIKDADPDLLEQSLAYYQQADEMTPEPDVANLHSKIRLYEGQVYLAQALYIFYNQSGDESEALQNAIDRFNQTLADYQANPSPDMKHLAAEAHSNLGLIERKMGNLASSADQYKQAIDLTELNDKNRRPFFQEQYQEVLEDLAKATAVP
jgi:tetratricopeptide (TPR) repeat protein